MRKQSQTASGSLVRLVRELVDGGKTQREAVKLVAGAFGYDRATLAKKIAAEEDTNV